MFSHLAADQPRICPRLRQHGLVGEKSPQVIRHIARRAIALRRVLLQRLQADVLQIDGDFRVASAGKRRLFLADTAQQVRLVFSPKRRIAGQQFVEDGAQREHVATRIQILRAAGLLRREVLRGSRNVSGLRKALARALIQGQAEIQQLGLQVRADQNIARLQIAVDDAALMQEMHGQRHLSHQFRPLLEAQGMRRPVQRSAFHVLHHEMRGARPPVQGCRSERYSGG